MELRSLRKGQQLAFACFCENKKEGTNYFNRNREQKWEQKPNRKETVVLLGTLLSSFFNVSPYWQA